MRTVVIVQARMGSTRLPGKVLMDIAGKTMLERVLERVSRMDCDAYCVATTDLQRDDALEKLCKKLDVPCFRGSETDVLDRYYQAAKSQHADIVVRVTSDCPLLDSVESDKVVAACKNGADYSSNFLVRRYPRGLDTEAFRFSVLERAWKEAKKPYEREHVTPYIFEHPNIFTHAPVTNAEDQSTERWTVDTPEDLEFVRTMYAQLGRSGDFSWKVVLQLLKKEPELRAINTAIVQADYRKTGREHFLFRADAMPAMGTGHLMRCITLAKAAASRGHAVTFLVASGVEICQEKMGLPNARCIQINAEAGSADDSHQLATMAEAEKATWIVIDGYQFGAAYQKAASESGKRTLIIDDYGHAKTYKADIILNQNIHASQNLYLQRNSDCTLLLGPAYALLREEFLSIPAHIIRSAASRILVTLGGSDPDNRTELVLRSINAIPGSLTVTVVTGAQNAYRSDLEELARASIHSISIVHDVSNMARLMMEADIAVAAAGTTTWELLCTGVPTVSGTIARNQEEIADALQKGDLAEVVGPYASVTEKALSTTIAHLLNSSQRRQDLALKGQAMVDGRGVIRVLEAVESMR